jgi:hypothetical protein
MRELFGKKCAGCRKDIGKEVGATSYYVTSTEYEVREVSGNGKIKDTIDYEQMRMGVCKECGKKVMDYLASIYFMPFRKV